MTTRGDDRVAVEVGSGVVVYPAREPGERWRAVWYENGRRRQCQAVSEDRLAAKLEKVTARLAADAANTERPGADLIAFYLSPLRHPAGKGWSRKHTDTQRRLCGRYLAPVIGHVACEDIKTGHLQEAVIAAPTAKEGDRVRRCISALVGAGIAGGYLTSPRLKLVHWQPGGGRSLAPARRRSASPLRWVGRLIVMNCLAKLAQTQNWARPGATLAARSCMPGWYSSGWPAH